METDSYEDKRKRIRTRHALPEGLNEIAERNSISEIQSIAYRSNSGDSRKLKASIASQQS